MQECLEDFVHHPNVIVSLELMFHVHEVFVEGIKPASQQFAHMEAHGRRCLEELAWILDQVKVAGLCGAHGGSVIAAEQCCHLAEDDA